MMWQHVEPVFVDIDRKTLTIDVDQIEQALQADPEIAGIMPVHVYGWPCDVERIDQLAKQYNVKVLYDAAPAFGTKVKGSSIFNFGDMSIVSFHATKIYHTVEGGAIICRDQETYEKAKRLINFGIDRQSGEILECGINGKLSEIHAAVGLCVLEDFTEILQSRKDLVNFYRKHIPLDYQIYTENENIEWNHAYYPILFPTEAKLLTFLEATAQAKIFPKRYFDLPLNKVSYLFSQQSYKTDVSEDICRRIVCLPCYCGLELAQLDIASFFKR